MIDSLDLDSLEESAYQSRFDDGIGDLLLGLAILAMGISFGTEMGGMAGVWAAMIVPMWYPLHRAVSEPRLGYVEFGAGRRAKVRRKKLGMSVMLGVSLLTGLAIYAFKSGDAPREDMRAYAALPFLGLLAIMIAVASMLLGLRRGYLYSALIIGSGLLILFVADVDPLRPALQLSGALIAVSGIYLLARFVRMHPRVEGPAA